MPRCLPLASAALALLGCYGSTTLEGDAADSGAEHAADAAETDAPGDEASADLPADTDGPSDIPREDAAGDCLPQDARPEGPCAMVLPGVRWDGSNCVPLGSGCSCEGADCGALYDTIEACVAARRHCYANDCEPQAVADDLCIDCTAEMFLGAFWDGHECFELRGCGCHGAGCDLPFRSAAECEAFHAECPAGLCRAGGGSWFPAEFGGCGFVCGGPQEALCYAPYADCLCPIGQTFRPEVGCAPDASCGARELCVATRGSWHPAAECYCGFDCGRPGDCDACLDSCDCGPARNFVEGLGCRYDETCAAAWGADLCTSTGGTWHDCEPGDTGCSCGDYHCGRPNSLEPCFAPGCDCGGGANFDRERGCVPDAACFFGGEGEECSGWGLEGSSCRPGLACCVECGMMIGCNYCRNPCCELNPGCEDFGCFPPPP